MTENWLPVVDYEGSYEVSDLGRVRSVGRTILKHGGRPRRLLTFRLMGRELRPSMTNGYAHVNLGAGNSRRISDLVAEAFIGPRPPGLGVLHNDGNARNDAATNLRYGDQTANMADAVRHGTIARGAKVNRRLSVLEACLILGLRGRVPAWLVADTFSITRGAVVALHRRYEARGLVPIDADAAWAWFQDFGLGAIETDLALARHEAAFGPVPPDERALWGVAA